MALADKIKWDIQAPLLNVLQGYKDHIDRCNNLLANGHNDVIEDGNTVEVSRSLHNDYVAQLSEFLIDGGILQGIAVPVDTSVPVDAPLETVSDLRPDDPVPVDIPTDPTSGADTTDSSVTAVE